MEPCVHAFFDEDTFTFSYVVSDPVAKVAAIIDPVLDYDPAAGRISTDSADRLVDHVRSQALALEWILETHVHADHLSAATYIKSELGGKIGIGARVVRVQALFADIFNEGASFAQDGSQFDRLFEDGEQIDIGAVSCEVMCTPGHTPACVTYVCNGHAFVGDTLFMPDYGTARADFPGGDAEALYDSARRILALPGDTRLYVCHDYGTEARSDFEYLTTVFDERSANVMINERIGKASFVDARQAKDADLATPRLLFPSVQFNMRAGAPPVAEANGQSYFKIPIRRA